MKTKKTNLTKAEKYTIEKQLSHAVALTLRKERAQFPSEDMLIATAKRIDPDDAAAHPSARAIAKMYRLMGFTGGVEVMQWPDGIIAAVAGDLSDSEVRRDVLPKAYWEAFGNVTEHAFKLLDE